MTSLSLVTRAAGLALAVILLILASGRGPADVAAQTGPWVAPAPEKAKSDHKGSLSAARGTGGIRDCYDAFDQPRAGCSILTEGIVNQDV